MDKSIDFFKDKNILVIGLGRTGISVIEKMNGLSRSLVGVDSNQSLQLKDNFEKYKKAERKNIKIFSGSDINQNKKLLNGIDLIIISPGVPNEIPLIKYAEKAEIPIWSELELSWKLMTDAEKKNTIAVTGTNGKTTVVTLIGEILENYGIGAQVCGNIGSPLIDTIRLDGRNKAITSGDGNRSEIRVIEVSSFQLERVYDFKPFIAVILNITSDHIDRHKTMESYIDLKFRLALKQSTEDYTVLNADDENINKKLAANNYYKNIKSNLIKYSLNFNKNADIYSMGSDIFYRVGKKNGKIDIRDALLKGNYNISNIMACIAAVKLYNIDDESISVTLKNFKPLEHRLEYLGTVNQIRCYNDSKSTNPDATVKALSNFNREVTLILGGLDKEMDFSSLIPVLNQKVNSLLLVGEASTKIHNMLKNVDRGYRIYRCKTLDEAVEVGFKVTQPGHVLLLSPSCASMDMFKNYKERGERFRHLVMRNKF